MSELPESTSLSAYRLQKLEEGVEKMQGSLKEAVGTFNGALSALQAQLTNYQLGLADRYVLRREADQKNQEIDDALRDQEKRLTDIVDKDSERGWKVALALLGALVSTALAAVGWLRPH